MTSPAGYFTGTPGTTASSVTLASMMETVRALRESQRKADANMTAALRGVIDKSKTPRWVWAVLLRVTPELLDDFLAERVPLTERFWDRLRAVFGPMRSSGNTTDLAMIGFPVEKTVRATAVYAGGIEPMSMYDLGGEG